MPQTHRQAIQTQSIGASHCQSQMPTSVMATAPDTPVQKKLTIAGSSRDTCRVSRPYSANISAAAKGSSAAMLMTPPPGFRITMIPAKPTAMAVQRRQPTASPRTGPDRAATSSG